MGRKNNTKYHKDLHQQAHEKLVKMQAFGESKKLAMEDGTYKNKIFSFSTYKTYQKHIRYFLRWMKNEHPEVTTLKKAQKYVNEWLQCRVNQGNLSAWTISVENMALRKLFNINADDPGTFVSPTRNRMDIQRSRNHTERDKHFSITNNAELISFCKGTGLRKSELAALKGKDFLDRNKIQAILRENSSVPFEKRTEYQNMQIAICKDALRFKEQYFIYVHSGKGGRQRISPIVGSNTAQIVERIKNTAPKDKVWMHLHSHADYHGYRSDYANTIYRNYCRDIDKIPYDKINKGTGHRYQSQVYCCRGDMHNKYDRAAMLLCSKALGHNRVSVVATNYLRGL